MKQSYHSYRRRVRCIRMRAFSAWIDLLDESPYSPANAQVIQVRRLRLERMARRNFERSRQRRV